jgi:hypothetical protein
MRCKWVRNACGLGSSGSATQTTLPAILSFRSATLSALPPSPRRGPAVLPPLVMAIHSPSHRPLQPRLSLLEVSQPRCSTPQPQICRLSILPCLPLLFAYPALTFFRPLSPPSEPPWVPSSPPNHPSHCGTRCLSRQASCSTGVVPRILRQPVRRRWHSWSALALSPAAFHCHCSADWFVVGSE